jgi:uncharacterized protein
MSDAPPAESPASTSVASQPLEASSIPRPEPVAPGERIASIDVLRGFALFGVLIMNGMNWFRTHPRRDFLAANLYPGFANAIVVHVQKVLFEGKFITLFAFLFGVGMAIQADRAEARGGRPRWFLVRRMLVLLAIGVAHVVLLWMGDILHVYAVLGLPFLLLLKRKPRTIAITAAVMLLLPFVASVVFSLVKLSAGMPPIRARTDERAVEIAEEIATGIRIYATGTWMEIAEKRISDAVNFAVYTLPSLPQTFAMFLLGLLAYRAGIFEDPAAHRRTLWRVIFAGAVVGLPIAIAMTFPPQPGETSTFAYVQAALFGLTSLSQTALGLAYGAGLLLLLQRPSVRARFAPVGDVGRMALTNYLMESLLCSLVFYGFGLGLHDRLSPVAALPIFLAIYAAHLLWSGPWLSRFRYGPVEWLWRSLTYGKAQPMRARKPATVGTSG